MKFLQKLFQGIYICIYIELYITSVLFTQIGLFQKTGLILCLKQELDASLTKNSLKMVSCVHKDLVDIVELQRSVFWNFEKNGKLNNMEKYNSKALESYANGLSNISGIFCCIVSFLILVINLSVWIYFLYCDIYQI